jgi:hypothetical protein
LPPQTRKVDAETSYRIIANEMCRNPSGYTAEYMSSMSGVSMATITPCITGQASTAARAVGKSCGSIECSTWPIVCGTSVSVR